MSDSSNVFNVDLEDEFIDDGSGKIHWHAWRRLLGFLLQHRRECVLVCICGALTGGLEMTHGLIVKAMLDDIEINQADANLWLWATLFLFRLDSPGNRGHGFRSLHAQSARVRSARSPRSGVSQHSPTVVRVLQSTPGRVANGSTDR